MPDLRGHRPVSCDTSALSERRVDGVEPRHRNVVASMAWSLHAVEQIQSMAWGARNWISARRRTRSALRNLLALYRDVPLSLSTFDRSSFCWSVIVIGSLLFFSLSSMAVTETSSITEGRSMVSDWSEAQYAAGTMACCSFSVQRSIGQQAFAGNRAFCRGALLDIF